MPTNHLISWPDLHCVGSLALWGLSLNLPAKYCWRPKKSLTIWARGPWHCAMWSILSWLLHHVGRPEVATFRTKTLNFVRAIHLNLVGENWMKGPGSRSYQYYCLLLLYAKMLRVRETEKKTRFFCHIFIINGILIGRGARLPMATPMYLNACSDLYVWCRFCILVFFVNLISHVKTKGLIFFVNILKNVGCCWCWKVLRLHDFFSSISISF